MLIGNTSEVIRSAVSHAADVGFIEGSQTRQDMRVQPWLSDELVIVAAPGQLPAGRSVTLRQLEQAPWILRETGSGTREAADSCSATWAA